MLYIYKNTDPKHVKFQRIIMGWLAIASLFFREIDLVWIFFAITILGLFTGTEYSVTTLVYKFFNSIFKINLVHISEHHIRYYQINKSVDFIDHILRLVASSAALSLFYIDLEIATWTVMSFLSAFMMISAYFGFCLSALIYIFLINIRLKIQKKSEFSSTCTEQIDYDRLRFNENCILAKRCFTPYKRCDSCHINITQCLGTKFNSSVIIIGILMAAFLFIDNRLLIQINILLVMGIIFWLGYQINYSTDELAQSNDANISLNKKLKERTLFLKEEVKRRTAEIEHMATHDMLTGVLNRFSFEKILIKALKNVDGTRSSHLAFIDLDQFKVVNDTVGHLAGDRLLCDMSSMFQKIVGEDGVVARLGGDEFAILFQGIDQIKAIQYCQEICDQAGSYAFIWEEKTLYIGTSIGLTTLEASMQDLKAVIHHADEACYVAKKSGRNQVRVHSHKDYI